MSAEAKPPEASRRRSETWAVIGEAFVIALAGVCLALAANWFSPRGLSLARNYFPEIKPLPAATAANTSTNQSSASAPNAATTSAQPPASYTNPPTQPQDETATAIQRVIAKGLQAVTFEQVKKLLNDPGYKQGLIIFVDARNDDEYQAGHIPGAYQLDYYHSDRYIAKVTNACQTAKQIVVYCHGGDCEDSDMTAIMLRDGGVPNEKLFVYAGGWKEWEPSGQPIETGARNSGTMRQANK